MLKIKSKLLMLTLVITGLLGMGNVASANEEYQKGFNDANIIGKSAVEAHLFGFNIQYDIGIKDVKKIKYSGQGVWGNDFSDLGGWFLDLYNLAVQQTTNNLLTQAEKDYYQGFAAGIMPFVMNPLWFQAEPQEQTLR